MLSPRSPKRPALSAMPPEEEKEQKDFAFSYQDFLALYAGNEASPHKNLSPLKTLLHEKKLRELEAALLIHLDNLDGIQSALVNDGIYPTGFAFVRDATKALPLAKRTAPDSLVVFADNLLLRSLSIMRGIRQAFISNNINSLHVEKLENAYEKLLDKTQLSIDEEKSFLEEAEKDFNSELIRLLHITGMNSELESQENYQDLLLHYRDLACALSPAKSLVTLLEDYQNNHVIRLIERADPITEKTPEQIEELNSAFNENGKVNFYRKKPRAFRIADEAFKTLLMKNNRYLPAQARYTIAPTAKNAYIVQNTMRVINKEDNTLTHEEEFWHLRSGSLVFIGKGESPEQIDKFAKQNLRQLLVAAQKYANKNDLYIVNLLTDISIQNQDQIIKFTKEAAKSLGIKFSRAPTNIIGLFEKLDLDAHLVQNFKDDGIPKTSRNPFNKPRRVNKAVTLVEVPTNKSDNSIVLITCASGQDRTGTVAEVTVINWLNKNFLSLNLIKTPTSPEESTALVNHLEQLRSLGGHNAFLASFAAPGSFGMKLDSKAVGLFNPETDTYYYRKTADTNKEVLLHRNAISNLLQKQIIKNPFNDHFEVFKKALLDLDCDTSTLEDFNQVNAKLLEWIDSLINFTPPNESMIHTIFYLVEMKQALLSFKNNEYTQITNLYELKERLLEFSNNNKSSLPSHLVAKLAMIDDIIQIKLSDPFEITDLEEKQKSNNKLTIISSHSVVQDYSPKSPKK